MQQRRKYFLKMTNKSMKWQYIHLYNLFYIQSYVEYTYQSLIVVKKNMMLDTNTIENATIHCVQAMSSLFVLAFCWIAVLITKKKIFLRDKSYLIQYISMFSGIHLPGLHVLPTIQPNRHLPFNRSHVWLIQCTLHW